MTSKFIQKVRIDLAPLIIFSLCGGVLADALDRKKMLWATEASLMILTTVLFQRFNRLHRRHHFVSHLIDFFLESRFGSDIRQARQAISGWIICR